MRINKRPPGPRHTGGRSVVGGEVRIKPCGGGAAPSDPPAPRPAQAELAGSGTNTVQSWSPDECPAKFTVRELTQIAAAANSPEHLIGHAVMPAAVDERRYRDGPSVLTEYVPIAPRMGWQASMPVATAAAQLRDQPQAARHAAGVAAVTSDTDTTGVVASRRVKPDAMQRRSCPSSRLDRRRRSPAAPSSRTMRKVRRQPVMPIQ
jgi:hypothetical protein